MEDLSDDVLSSIVIYVTDSNRKELSQLVEKNEVLHNILGIGLVSKQFHRVVHESSALWKHLCSIAGFTWRARPIYQGTYLIVFKAGYQLLMEKTRLNKMKSSRLGYVSRNSEYNLETFARPRLPDKFLNFTGLMRVEEERVIERASELLKFLRSFITFSHNRPESSTLLRYRMFLHLKINYPQLFLIPTAEILYAELCHVFQTKQYHQDLTSMQISLDPLVLSSSEYYFYSEAIVATQKLWEKVFPGTSYLPEDVRVEWKYWETERSRKGNRVDFHKPPSYFPAIGPLVCADMVAQFQLPNVSLTEQDLKNNEKWREELERQISYSRDKLCFCKDDRFLLEQLTFSYKRFLYLVKCHPEHRENLSPPVTIDLMWRAHQSTPLLYEREMRRIIGEPLYHRLWPSSNFEEVSDTFTQLWLQEFSTPISEDHHYTNKRNRNPVRQLQNLRK
eukprot:TRINITY_DN4286_c0_g3_i1.p1 TRINITY_DN4286_c0_g3~~TRINITY_DN4286_c0_g3_i1.p1  ORF type:complete len:467 (+),score=76.37 TRINITY_DN4286_c0_g3_i1:57-1403(+)